MPKTNATFECDAHSWTRFVTACASRNEDPSVLLSGFVRLKLKGWAKAGRRVTTLDGATLARLRLHVAEALAASATWVEMAFALDARGLAYHLSGGGLILIDAETGEVLCKASEVGPSYGTLIARFGALHPADNRRGSVQVPRQAA